MPTAQTKVPKYSIDRNDFTRETGIFRPSELCVKIELQELTSAREIDLDITEQNLELKQLFFGKDLEGVGYALSLSLPCPVLCYQGSAKFDMAERVLTVTIPVADAAIPTGAKPAMKAPKYSIERSPPIDPVAIRQSPPRELCVAIELEELTSAGEIDLDITEQKLELKHEGVGYALSLPLPYPVLEEQGSAKFVVATRVLTVTIPVGAAKPKAQTKVPPTPFMPTGASILVKLHKGPPGKFHTTGGVDFKTERRNPNQTPKGPPTWVRIAYIEPNSISSRADLRVGDRVISIGGKKMSTAKEATPTLKMMQGEISMEVVRGPKDVEMTEAPAMPTSQPAIPSATGPPMMPAHTAQRVAEAGGPYQPFALGAKVKITRSGGKVSVCTVVGLPEDNDFGLYTVQLNGTNATKECSTDQLRAADEPSDGNPFMAASPAAAVQQPGPAPTNPHPTQTTDMMPRFDPNTGQPLVQAEPPMQHPATQPVAVAQPMTQPVAEATDNPFMAASPAAAVQQPATQTAAVPQPMAQPVAEATANSPRYNERLSRARSHNSPNSPLSTAAVTVAQPVAQPAVDAFPAAGFDAGFGSPAPTPAADPFAASNEMFALADAAIGAANSFEMRITFPSGAPLGVGLIRKDGKVIVDLVQPTSAAAAVPINSPLKEINGTSCEGKGMKEVMAMIASAKSAGQVIATFLVESSAEDEEDEFTTKI